ncbi:hypothetical protein [Chitinimonas sp. BJB300]|uniref:hypothetical protein n=1 Tax=Chitinimonas sp. BJB300 TaxID=1559339 RepID=UPI000C119EFD|nr:hypothetical protein [Chitinimonas sp. BJB300]PHV11711.1 hypothetical protein CSQ89_09340 [Chitinimonas sp. BJB300]TSJ89990.1 hypothetical protein FG002_007305 [Chitinimonas sp. BJB300]
MPPIFQDALDIARFRVKALEHYVYEWWQPVLWLTVLAALPAFTAIGRVPSVGFLALLAIILSWVQVLMFTFFFSWWVKRHKDWRGQGSLFPIVVLSTTVQLIGLVLPLIPDAVLSLGLLAIWGYQICILVHALTVSTGLPRRHLVNGLLLYFVGCVLLAVLLAIVALQAGWIRPPPAAGKVPATVVPMGQS